jgi:hypothetical protein
MEIKMGWGGVGGDRAVEDFDCGNQCGSADNHWPNASKIQTWQVKKKKTNKKKQTNKQKPT